MGTMAGIGTEIAGTAARLRQMHAAIAGLDRRLAELEERRRGADAGDAFAIGQQIRDLTEQRLAGAELLAEAERQAAVAALAFQRATDEAVSNLGKISAACTDAARRFDRALADAVAILSEIEAEADPLVRTLLTDGALQRNFTGWIAVQAAIRAAFASRLNPAESLRDRRTKVASIEKMISDARATVAAIKKPVAA